MKKLKNKMFLIGNTRRASCRDVTILKLVITSLCLALTIFCKAQVFSPAVITSAGTSGTSATCIIDWTLGEVAIETYTQTTVILTQGFQQNFIGSPTAIEIAESNEFAFYPNPVREQLYISLKHSGIERYLVEIINIKGVKVWNKMLESAKAIEKLDVNNLPSGMYMLRISSHQGKILKSTKFIKL
jgi:hypothetical protein